MIKMKNNGGVTEFGNVVDQESMCDHRNSGSNPGPAVYYNQKGVEVWTPNTSLVLGVDIHDTNNSNRVYR